MKGRVKSIRRFGDFDDGLENWGIFGVRWRIPFLSLSLLLLLFTKLPHELGDILTNHVDVGIEQSIAATVAPTVARPNLTVIVGDDVTQPTSTDNLNADACSFLPHNLGSSDIYRLQPKEDD